MNNYGMGQRFNPHTIRTGVIRDWDSKKWYNEENLPNEEKTEHTNPSSMSKIGKVKDWDEAR